VSYGTARKSLDAAIENAVAAGEPPARIAQLTEARSQIDAGRRFRPAELQALNVNAIQ
jgi:flavin-binding protein dodecin